jgi:SAM-dependent methyltransferase
MLERALGQAVLAARYIRRVSASGGWETWSWDESLFAGAAAYYEQGRLPYAPGLADALARALALDGAGRLLDVGCGPGTVTLRLAPLFEAAVGLDPDPGMLAAASGAAARQGVSNVSWVGQRAEALPAGLGRFRVVTFAASFHWMDRPRVASAVATMLDPGGAAVQVDAPGYRPERTADDIVAQVFSSSGTAPHLFGDRQPDFEQDLRKILARASPAGRFSVRLPDNILRIWRRPLPDN